MVRALSFAHGAEARSEMYLHFDPQVLPDALVNTDYTLWVIDTSDGVVLFDTGFSPETGRRHGVRGSVDPVRSLREAGVDPAKVREIVISHLHWDHIGNIGEFPRARVHVQRNEFEFWTGPLAARREFARSRDDAALERLRELHRLGRVVLVDGDMDLGGGLKVIALPGHTPGSQGLLAVCDGERVLLAGDALHYPEQLDADFVFTLVADVPAALGSFDRIRGLAAEGVTIVSGHGSGESRGVSKLPSGARSWVIAGGTESLEKAP
jgi:glyoxylase-like metal-dependent hydrolase (beta-lactamase superfamily II)